MSSEFIDVSVWTDVSNWKTVSDQKKGVLIKSSQNYWIDSKFKAHWIDSGVYGMARGIWHFYNPNMGPESQISGFLQAYHSILGWKPKVIFLDIEELAYLDQSTGMAVIIKPPGKTQYTYWIMKWLDAVEKDTGCRPGIYTRASFWNQWVYPSGTKFTWDGQTYTTPTWSNYMLWVAHYFVSQPTLPRDWKMWDFWQYSGDAAKIDGIRSEIDLDYCSWDESKISELMGEVKEPPKADRSAVKEEINSLLARLTTLRNSL